MPANPQLRVSLAFAGLPEDELDNFATGVSAGLYATPAFTATPPPVSQAELDAAKLASVNALAAAAAGGPTETAAKDVAIQDLVSKLRLLAGWVQIKCNNERATLRASGFQEISTNRASVVLGKPQSFTVDNGTAGQLVGRIKPPVANCNMYEGRATPEGGAAMPSVFTGDSQHIYFPGLTPGVMYKLEARCLGGAAPGYSDWSDPTSHRAM